MGANDRRDDLHIPSRRAMERSASGSLGHALVSDYVLDETVTILGARHGIGPSGAVAAARTLLSSPRVRLLFVDAPAFQASLEAYRRYGGKLSFTDVTTFVLMRREGCRTLLSGDADFDRLPGIERRAE